MKKTLLYFSFIVFSSFTLSAQVTAGQIDDFEDNTTQSWFEGSATTPTNEPSDGPAGVNDNYLRDTATGTSGPGGRMVIRNLSQWAGDYTNQAIVAIKMDVRAITSDLNIRVGITGAGGKFCTTNAVPVLVANGWTSVTIPISAGDLSSVSDGSGGGPPGTDAAATLANASEVRILSSSIPSWRGDIINGEMHLDNIEASTTLSVSDFSAFDGFNIYPNPGKTYLNISIPHLDYAKVEVYDLLGKRIHFQDLSLVNTRISVAQWQSGMYLVKVTNGNSEQTKRFVKQ